MQYIYLNQEHNNCKENFCNLCQKINTDWTKLETSIHLGHEHQYRLHNNIKLFSQYIKICNNRPWLVTCSAVYKESSSFFFRNGQFEILHTQTCLLSSSNLWHLGPLDTILGVRKVVTGRREQKEFSSLLYVVHNNFFNELVLQTSTPERALLVGDKTI